MNLLILLCVELVLVKIVVNGHGLGGQVKFVWLIVWLEYIDVTSTQINNPIIVIKDKAMHILIA